MNRSERDEWLGCFLTEMEASRLENASVPVAPGKALGLVELLQSWRDHVVRIEGELELPDSDRTVWGVYDLIAALALRSFIARGMEIADQNSLEGFRRALGDVDSRFREFTEGDESGVVRRLDEGERPSGEWWWDRVPRIGPIRREIERIKATR
ncbi:hypothetical protein ACFOOM_31950 [Streptomyces echinoruber]|uniref:Uncharacterized protein n=1 Tax=Streptomyces echinoruber TaxID=68898 RepID=A0A918RRV2_9ACTN|nr:hypothetical protein [Streptomyces echinoruber]GHA10648.1 hypothetical protein GCM10010389_57220 [Streptomyces echinoruber]